MANVNKVILIGNLTRDPVLSHTPSNTPVVDFGLAINHRWRSADGQQREDVCFIDIRAFGKQAELIHANVKKGRQLYVEGRLSFDQWTGQDGQRRSKHRVTLDAFQFLDQRPRDGADGSEETAAATDAEPESPRETRRMNRDRRPDRERELVGAGASANDRPPF